MKLKFKQQGYQSDAVRAVTECFAGQPKISGSRYAIDPGRVAATAAVPLPGLESEGFANAAVALTEQQLLDNLQGVQRRQNLPVPRRSRRQSSAT